MLRISVREFVESVHEEENEGFAEKECFKPGMKERGVKDSLS